MKKKIQSEPETLPDIIVERLSILQSREIWKLNLHETVIKAFEFWLFIQFADQLHDKVKWGDTCSTMFSHTRLAESRKQCKRRLEIALFKFEERYVAPCHTKIKKHEVFAEYFTEIEEAVRQKVSSVRDSLLEVTGLGDLPKFSSPPLDQFAKILVSRISMKKSP